MRCGKLCATLISAARASPRCASAPSLSDTRVCSTDSAPRPTGSTPRNSKDAFPPLHAQLAPTADWFEIAVIHHTDCGSGLFANDDLRVAFADASGLDEAELARLAVIDPAKTAAADVRLLEESKLIGPQVAISGHVYDVATGIVTRVAGH
jgi:hypothetical protein